MIKNIVADEVQGRVRDGKIKHPVVATRYNVKRLIEEWRLLKRFSRVQGPTPFREKVKNIHILLSKFIVDHGGLMKDRNRPIDGVVSGPRLSLDAVTDYVQRLAEQKSFTVSRTTVYREMKQANIKLKKVRNDVSRFNMDDKLQPVV